jgi:hypothetical protein
MELFVPNDVLRPIAIELQNLQASGHASRLEAQRNVATQ